jgi:hypothetical protein
MIQGSQKYIFPNGEVLYLIPHEIGPSLPCVPIWVRVAPNVCQVVSDKMAQAMLKWRNEFFHSEN